MFLRYLGLPHYPPIVDNGILSVDNLTEPLEKDLDSFFYKEHKSWRGYFENLLRLV